MGGEGLHGVEGRIRGLCVGFEHRAVDSGAVSPFPKQGPVILSVLAKDLALSVAARSFAEYRSERVIFPARFFMTLAL
jgi:hypothetical protein